MTDTPVTAVRDGGPAPAPVRGSFELDGPAVTSGATAVPDGFLRLLAHRAVEQARTDGPVSALRNLLRAESFLRAFRRHLLVTPREARGDSYKLGLIMIELMILRESLHSPGRPLAL